MFKNLWLFKIERLRDASLFAWAKTLAANEERGDGKKIVDKITSFSYEF